MNQKEEEGEEEEPPVQGEHKTVFNTMMVTRRGMAGTFVTTMVTMMRMMTSSPQGKGLRTNLPPPHTPAHPPLS